MIAVMWAGVFTFTLWFSYRAWIRSHIRSRMLNVHKFGPTIVPAFMSDSSSKETPSQVLLIGPKNSGKSRAYEACGGVFTPSSARPIFASFYQGDGEHRKWVSIGDMPGENLGEQLYYIRTFRTTRLVLVVSAEALVDTIGKLADAGNYTLEDFPKLCHDRLENFGPHAHDYFTALRLLFSRLSAGEAAFAREYDVQSLTLVLNYRKDDNAQVGAKEHISREGLSRLAAEIGMKLGLRDWYRVGAIITSVRGNSFLREWFAMDSTASAKGDKPMYGQVVFGGSATNQPRVVEDKEV
jgi:hypothetical protein